MDGSRNTILSEVNIHKKQKLYASFVDVNFVFSDMHVSFGILIFRELIKGYK